MFRSSAGFGQAIRKKQLLVCLWRELFRISGVNLQDSMSIHFLEHTQDRRPDRKTVVLSLLGDLHRVALQLTQSPVDAEELVAETVARACENFSSLRDVTKAKQWTLRILSNTFLSTCRAKKRHQEVEYSENSEEDEKPFSLYDEVSWTSFEGNNPERELIAKLMDEDIHNAIAALPEEFRVAVVLCDIEGCSYDEIAATLEIPKGTVRSRLFRGRALLQKRLYHYALERGWAKPRNEHTIGKKKDELCECERAKLPASPGARR